MNRKESYRNRIEIIAVLCVLITLMGPLYFIYHMKSNVAGCIMGAVCLFFDGMIWLVHRTDERYIREIVTELSELLDTLLELEEREIFPDIQDTMLSKLQSNVTKLIRRMRHQNEMSRREQERMKGIISDLSHQLKTPLANLKMYCRFLQNDNLSEKQYKDYLNTLCLSVDRLNFLSENMIKISRLETGLINLKCRRNCVDETVLEAVKDIYSKACREGCDIIYQGEKGVMAEYDASWTREAVFNLLDNAVKYSDHSLEKKILLNVRKLGIFVEISVEDRNGSIPEKEQSNIFKRFYRGERSSGREGVGIGLYLTREIVLREGGYVRVKAVENGNKFSIFLRY